MIGGKKSKRNVPKRSKKVSKRSKKAPKRSVSKRKSVSKPRPARGCVRQTWAKYHKAPRTSPSYPANECCGRIMTGNDGNMYESRRNSAGICQWRRV